MAYPSYLKILLLLHGLPSVLALRGKRNGADETPLASSARQNPSFPELSVQKNDKGDENGNGNDNENNGNANNVRPSLSGLTLGDVWDFVANSDGTSAAGICETREYVDVIIIGAGMAGVSAASTLNSTDPSLSYVVLESQNRVGGRMRSVDFGVPDNNWKIEDGANW